MAIRLLLYAAAVSSFSIYTRGVVASFLNVMLNVIRPVSSSQPDPVGLVWSRERRNMLQRPR